MKALPLPAFFFWPGGQKRGLFAPCRPATSERDEVPVVLACGGESVTCLPSPFCAAEAPLMPNAKAIAKADSVVTTRMMSSRLVYVVALTF